MPIYTLEPRRAGLGTTQPVVLPITLPAVAAVIANYTATLRQAEEEEEAAAAAESGLLGENGTAILAGAGAFLLGLVIAKTSTRKRRRRRR